MPISIAPSIANRINSNMNVGGGIELPFPTVYFWWSNGDPRAARMAQVNPASYFGGWTCKAEDLEALCETEGRNVPAGLVRDTITPQDGGKAFDVYQTRNLIVATIGQRSAWKDPQNSGKARSQTQLLAYLAERTEQGFLPWGPVVLSVKSYQSTFLKTALQDWNRHIGKALKQYAPGVPAWFFYLALGSFGAQPVTRSVGKEQTKNINPVTAFLPQTIDEATMQKLFVTDEIAAVMAAYSEEADDWLRAWDGKDDAQGGQAQGQGRNDYGAPDNFPPDDNIPF